MRPQGRRGELLAEPLSDLPDIFASGQPAWLAPTGALAPASDDEASALRIEEHWFPTGKNAGRIVLKLSGCDSISAAEALAGQQLLIPATLLPQLDADTFYVGDLLGCTLFDGKTPIGPVVDVHFPTSADGRRLPDAAPLLAVQLPSSDPEDPTLIPFIRAWLDSVDLQSQRITMHLPAGLLDTEL
jgi:16S rRNA processing protein RimM